MVERVGVRALQQHASKVIRDVAAGETVEITDRGRLVAQLVPVRRDRLSTLIEAGQARPARRTVGDLDAPLAAAGAAHTLSELVAGAREHER